jgi:hypothetical protein
MSFININNYLDFLEDFFTNIPFETEFDFNYNSNISNININNVLANSLYEKPRYKHVIDDNELTKLEKIVFTNELSDKYNKSCPIMQTDFEEGDIIIKLECNHCFEPDAITKWLKEEKSECPVCRHQFKSKEIKNKDYDEIINPYINYEQDIITERNNLINSLTILRDLNRGILPL